MSVLLRDQRDCAVAEAESKKPEQMTMEDSPLLATEKSVDMRSCQCQQSTDTEVERSCSETQVENCQRFWSWLALLLLILTFISGLSQSPVASWIEGAGSIRLPSRPGDDSGLTYTELNDGLIIKSQQQQVIESSEPDVSKSMHFDIIGFRDITDENPFPRELYETVGQTVVRDGKAYLTSQLTMDNGVVPKPHSVGRLMYPRPFRVKHRGVHRGEQMVVSFHTSFVFSIKNLIKDREAIGDGFAFVMVPQNNVLGSGGGYLGVTNSTGVATNTFAVEFDIWRNSAFQDISNNHVGLNVNSMVSVAASEAGYWSQDDGGAAAAEGRQERFNHVDLTSGKKIQAWIDYDGLSQELTVSISPELGSKPRKPLLSKRLDLTRVFRKYMYAGFSAATGEFSANHVIHSWKFEKHSNPRSGGFIAPKSRNHIASASQARDNSGLLPYGSKRCSDFVEKLSSAFYLLVKDFSADFLSASKELSKLWPYLLLGFVVGIALMQISLRLHRTCVACWCGPVECDESTGELQMLAEADKQGRYILVLGQRQPEQQQPRMYDVV